MQPTTNTHNDEIHTAPAAARPRRASCPAGRAHCAATAPPAAPDVAPAAAAAAAMCEHNTPSCMMSTVDTAAVFVCWQLSNLASLHTCRHHSTSPMSLAIHGVQHTRTHLLLGIAGCVQLVDGLRHKRLLALHLSVSACCWLGWSSTGAAAAAHLSLSVCLCVAYGVAQHASQIISA